MTHWTALLSSRLFYTSSDRWLPWLLAAFLVCVTYGLVGGLVLAPADYQQGDGFRIIYVHVPSALTAMAVYLVMAIAGILTLVFRLKLAAMCLTASAKIGASFTLLALITGSLWGKPMWGTWWIWDARLTSVLILLFLYVGVIALQSVIADTATRDRAGAILAVTGVINLPVIHYSVIWWNTLHQGPTISQLAKPSIAPAMLYPLLAMIAAFLLFYAVVLLIQMRSELLVRERNSQWLREVLCHG